jgi:hypothetical protein
MSQLTLSEFRKDFIERARATAETEKTFLREAFATVAASALEEAEELSDFNLSYFKGPGSRNRILMVDGYAVDEVDGSVKLLVVDFRGNDEPDTLTQTEATTLFGRLQAFVEESLTGRLHPALEESAPAQDLAATLHERAQSITRFRCYLATDCILSGRVRDLPEGKIGKVPVEYHIWDIGRFHRIEESKLGRDTLEVDFEEFSKDGIPCLTASVDSGEYGAYLCVLPGETLASIYDRFGSRLLEGNVRSFLSVRGKVNKGIRTTILNEPPMFFAYNNGIAATATSVSVEASKNGLRLKKVTDLEIVNGAQTTASLSAARRDDKASLAQVFVQMKLSVISPEKADGIIPQISRYANTQNKVSDADFFSNHPFHIRMEQISRRLWAPAKGGAQYETHWYYERARGQYLNEQSRLTASGKRRFLQQNPREQLMTKTDLAKVENTWRRLPHKVSQGAQKNFITFAEWVGSRWDGADAEFNEEFFRQAIAKTIVFKAAAAIVSQADWYESGYRANIVTFTIAKLVDLIDRKGGRKTLDLRGIWTAQGIPSAVEEQVALVAREVFRVVVSPPAQFQNVTEWCKKDACWSRVEELDIALTPALTRELTDLSEVKAQEKSARDLRKVDAGIEAQKGVVELGSVFWTELLSWGSTRSLLTPDEQGILSVGAKMPRWIPSEAQSVRMLQILEKMREEGFRSAAGDASA